MTGKELIQRAMRNETLPRVPWVPYTGVQTGRLKGWSATEILTDGEKLYESLLEARRQYSPDGMPVVFDLQLEAEVLGCDLLWADEAPPTVRSHPLADTMEIPTHLSRLGRRSASTGYRGHEASPRRRAGYRPLRSYLRSLHPRVPSAQHQYLHGYVRQPGLSAKAAGVLHRCLFDGGGLLHRGRHGRNRAVDPLISQISPDSFEEFMKAPFSRLFSGLRERGVLSSFFVCGDATKNIEKMCKVGPDCLSIDENIDLEGARRDYRPLRYCH